MAKPPDPNRSTRRGMGGPRPGEAPSGPGYVRVAPKNPKLASSRPATKNDQLRGRGTNRNVSAAPAKAPASTGPTGGGMVKAVNRTTPTTTTKALKEAQQRKPTTTQPPTTRPTTTRPTTTNNRPTTTTRPTTPANTRSASARGTAAPAKAKSGVNAATQAVRDARAVSKAAGERYVRKAGGEKSVNARTQARRVERATVRGQRKATGTPSTSPGGTTPTRPSQRGATDWQQQAGAWTGTGINPAFDPNNTDAQYVADQSAKYRDYEGGTISAADIAKNLRAQIVAAMADGKTQVVLPDGEKWAALQSTVDQIDQNLARMASESTTAEARREARQNRTDRKPATTGLA